MGGLRLFFAPACFRQRHRRIVAFTSDRWTVSKRADRCACIKPKPYFLHKATGEYRVDLRRSFVVGDHPHDVQLARNAGAQGVYVLTGHGAKHVNELSGSAVATHDIAEAAEWILSHCRT
jgi:D-glycero-D-manno-heptose 1,7-bisphosphate phosphatase